MTSINIYKMIFVPIVILLLAVALFLLNSYPNVSTILGGVALFLIGMEYMEAGFKAFSSGAFEYILQKSIDNTPKAIFMGFITTAIVQSSSLISIITISFLSAELIALSSAIGVIFGSNIGTTATSWLVSLFGLEIKISHYAMPMIIVGIFLPLFSKSNTWRGIASIFIGLGIIFLGISYMKDGFETLKNAIDLAHYAMSGYMGVLVYVLVGAIATIIIQSSSATMAIIITALATGQIEYANALALAIGANVGTTVTASLAALKSNENGKRLAVAHFIFNIVTAAIAVIFIYQLTDLVDLLATKVHIGADDYAMKLALFHTIFNVVGVLLVAPFVSYLVKFLNTLFVPKGLNKGKSQYLDTAALVLPSTALLSIVNETKHLYSNAFDIISRGLNLKKKNILSEMTLDEVIEHQYTYKAIDIDGFYQHWIKGIYGEIIDFATKAQANMPEEYIEELYKLKLANRDIVEAIKDTKHLQKNIFKYTVSRNKYIQEQYNDIRKGLTQLLRTIESIKNSNQDEEIVILLSKAKIDSKRYDIISNGTLDRLIRRSLITNQMATSLMNDSDYAYNISQKLINMAEVLFIDIGSDLKKLNEDLTITDEEVTSHIKDHL